MLAQDRILEIGASGAPLPDAFGRRLVSAFVRQCLNAPALAEATFADLPPECAPVFRMGGALTFSLRSGARLFEGEVTGLEYEADGAGGRLLRVRAYDALHRLRKRQRTRALTDTAFQDLLSELAGDARVDWESRVTGPDRPLVIQHDQSDLDLLLEMSAGVGAYLQLSAGTLRAFNLAGDGSEALSLRLGQELLAGRAALSAETLRRSTAVRGWDTARVATFEATTSVASQDAEEMRDVGFGAFEGLGERVLVDRPSVDAAEAEALAQADLDRAAAGQIDMMLTAEGDPRLRPGRLIVLEGLGPEVDGRICVTRATHLFDAQRGYVTELDSAPPAARPAPRGSLATVARVTDADDPEGLTRVRARLPTYGDVETGWMPVVLMGAGASKGVAILPEPDDDVLVLFPDGDPARGLVLGGLYGDREAPGRPRGASGARGFAVRTPGGQALTLDSVTSLCRLETASGDIFELTPHGARLSVTQDLVIEAPGRRLTIRAAAVEFERG